MNSPSNYRRFHAVFAQKRAIPLNKRQSVLPIGARWISRLLVWVSGLIPKGGTPMFDAAITTTIALDTRTLFIVTSAVTALLGVLLLFAWRHDRVGALAWWGAAYLVGAFAVSLWAIGASTSTLPASIPTAVLFVACGMTWNAARVFHARPVMWGAMLAGSIIWLGACSLPAFPPIGASRFALASAIVAIYSFLTAAELWRERRRSLAGRPALFAPTLHGLVFLFPIAIASLVPEREGVITLATAWLAVFVLEMLLYAVGTAFLVLVLAKERTLRAHKSAALTDPLTGLFNRRGLVEAARELAEKHARKAGKPVAMLAFDLDYFKSINDRFGHALGDDVIKLFAATANSSLRLTDFVVRLGGEEFVAIMPGTLEDGLVVGERIRAAFEAAGRTVSGRYIGATVSVGVASHESAANIDALLARADAALYAAKANGRNRVEAEMQMFDLLQTTEPDSLVEGLPMVDDADAWEVHPDWLSPEQSRAAELERRAA
jgi:diguanylate cyclase (GGDEF)-like protein